MEKSLPFELLTEVPWDNSTTPQYNPLEKLPILLLPDGSSVYESSHILQYLELKHPRVPLLPDDIDGKPTALKLEMLCDGVCDAVVLSLFEKMRLGGGSPEWLARQRRKIESGMAEMARLVDACTWVVGDRFGLSDIAVGTAAGYLSVRFKELPWRTLHPGLAAFADRRDQRRSFRDSQPCAQTLRDKVV